LLGGGVIGEKKKANKLFYYLRPEELIPEDHILRLIDRYVDFSFIRPRVEHLYSHTGRPSVDPDVMMRMLLLGYLFGISSERRLCDEVGMHMGIAGLSAYLWRRRFPITRRFPRIVMAGLKRAGFTSRCSTKSSSSVSRRV